MVTMEIPFASIKVTAGRWSQNVKTAKKADIPAETLHEIGYVDALANKTKMTCELPYQNFCMVLSHEINLACPISHAVLIALDMCYY